MKSTDRPEQSSLVEDTSSANILGAGEKGISKEDLTKASKEAYKTQDNKFIPLK